MSSRHASRSPFRVLPALVRAAVGLLAVAAPGATQGPVAAARSTAAAPSPALARMLAGGEPTSVADLRALQAHVQALLEHVLPATVSLGGASGVLVEGGYVLTAGHVSRIAGRRVTIKLSDGREIAGETLGANHRTDTGLIRVVTEGDFPCCKVGHSSALHRGDWCLMLGHPSGTRPGRSAPARLGRVLRVPESGYLVTDCPMQAGDSGGPLFDMAGEVVGINSRISRNLADNEHVPSDAFLEEWSHLIKGEVVQAERRRGWRRPRFGARWDRDADRARVREVRAGTPAEAAGLRAGDVIVSVGGREVSDRWQAARALRDASGEVVVVVQRGEQRVELSVELGAGRER